jgi:hypothetical protein
VSWTLGRVAFALLCLAALLIMCAGYVGLDALVGAAVIVGAIGFVLLVVRTLR